jgi:hypothetical protein
MDINQQKEQFSNAYVRAVASVAGYALYKPEVDEDSVDWGIAARGGKGTNRSPRVELQLKCTARDMMDEQHVRFPLKIKNYDDLRQPNYQVPRILVVVVVPDRIEDWLDHSEQALAMRHCGYWTTLREYPPTDNAETVTIPVPRANQFTVEAVRGLMDRVRQGGLP